MTERGRPDNLRLDDQLCFALYAATNAIVRAYRPLLQAIGLTYPQYLVMLALWERGAQTVSSIAERLELPAHGVTPLLQRLESAGLLTRVRDRADRRVVRVELTERGIDLEHAASTVQHEVAAHTGLCGADFAVLRAQLHALAATLGEPMTAPDHRRRTDQNRGEDTA